MTSISDTVAEVLAAEAAAINGISVTDEFEVAVRLMANCACKVIATGMGKAGHVAHRFAAVLCSTGTPAAYLHPGEAAHGDLGMVERGDNLVAFSTSGKTREVLELVRNARVIGLPTIIAITSHPDGPLRQYARVVIDMGIIDEPDPLKLVPSASSAAMAAIGDALAIALMRVKGVTRQEFGLLHHAGYLGEEARR